MRLNRGTIALVLISAVVIVGVLILNSQQATAPGEPTATPLAGAGPLFESVDAEAIVRFEVRDNLTGQRTVMNKNEDGTWSVGAVSELQSMLAQGGMIPQPYQTDQTAVTGSVDDFAGLEADTSFEVDDLSQFGLTNPAYSIYAVTDNDTAYIMHVGGENPQGTRFYVVPEEGTSADVDEAIEIAPPEGEDSTEEVEATESADDEAEDAADAESEATAEAESDEADEADDAVEDDADEDAESEATAEAESDEAEEDSEDEAEATEESDDEADEEADDESEEAESDEADEAKPTEEATAEAPEPLVELSAPATVYTVSRNSINRMIGYLASPPYIIPTPTPTAFPTANPFSEVEMTATAQIQGTATMQAFMDALAEAQATEEPTEEASGDESDTEADESDEAADESTPEPDATEEEE